MQSDKKIEEDTLPKKRLTINSVGTVKLGTDVFINLKTGSIHKYYSTG